MDLYLIHQPYNDYYGAWRALEELYEDGKVKAIGVDNFTQDRMADFLFFNKVKPAVNMIECNTYFQREDERKYLKEQNILMQAWSPLAAGKEVTEFLEKSESVSCIRSFEDEKKDFRNRSESFGSRTWVYGNEPCVWCSR